MRIDPAKIRTILSGTRRSQCEDAEWRCLSFREARILDSPQGRWEVIGSSGASAAQFCPAWLLREEMVPLCAVLVAHEIERGRKRERCDVVTRGLSYNGTVNDIFS